MAKAGDDSGDVGKRLALELGSELRLQVEGIDWAVRTEVVGMEPSKYLIVRTPDISNVSTTGRSLLPGDRVVSRFMDRGVMLGFESEVLEQVSRPERLLFLSYPDIVTPEYLRASARIDCFIPGQLHLGTKTMTGVVTDLSVSGCLWRIKSPRAEEQAMLFTALDRAMISQLQIKLPNAEKAVLIKGKPRNIRKDDTRIRVGIEFVEQTSVAREQLAAYIDASL